MASSHESCSASGCACAVRRGANRQVLLGLALVQALVQALVLVLLLVQAQVVTAAVQWQGSGLAPPRHCGV